MDVKSMNDEVLLDEYLSADYEYSEYGSPGKDVVDELRAELLSRLRELSELREQTRWIPVSERLPEVGEIVLWSHRKWERAKEGYMVGSGRLKIWGAEYSTVSNMLWKQLPPISTENVSYGDKNSNESEDK